VSSLLNGMKPTRQRRTSHQWLARRLRPQANPRAGPSTIGRPGYVPSLRHHQTTTRNNRTQVTPDVWKVSSVIAPLRKRLVR